MENKMTVNVGMPGKTVMVIGATGALGSKICKALLDSNVHVRAMVRASSSTEALRALGVSDFVIGDMLDPASLRGAFGQVPAPDAVIASAAGYTRHSKGDTADTDRIGYRNLVDAAKAAMIPRFVLISILGCDRATSVPHFHDKYRIEQYLKEKGQPFVALRPGGFLDQARDFILPGLKKGIFPAFVEHVPFGMIYTPDLARYAAAAAASIPDTFLNSSIDVGWDKAYRSEEVAAAFSRVLKRRIEARPGIPPFVRKVIFPVAGVFSEPARDMSAMLSWIEGGNYVAGSTTLQKEAFGDVPTVDEAVHRYCSDRGLVQ
jgi:uncharacterized protein YbjT (DUF2867 family)